MNEKATTKKSKKSFSRKPVEEAPPEMTGAEKFFEQIKPHISTIILAVVAGVLGLIAIVVFISSRFDRDATQWRELNNASAVAAITNDVNPLKQVAANNPDTKAGLWALQLAGDEQLRRGLQQLSTDREGGFALIRKSKESFESVVDAPSANKTTMLQRRSHFSYAYACESLGDFKLAKTLYEELVNEAPDSAFAASARRGIGRCSNEDYATLYAKFENWEEEVIGDAPGPLLPDRPRISDFPEIDLPPGQKPPVGDATVPDVEKTGTEKNEETTENDFPTGDAAKPGSDGDKNADPTKSSSETTPTEKQADKTDVDPAKTDGDDK